MNYFRTDLHSEGLVGKVALGKELGSVELANTVDVNVDVDTDCDPVLYIVP